MSKGIESKVREIIGREIKFSGDISKIGLEDNLREIGLGSLAFIRAVIAMEIEFGMEFADSDLDVKDFDNLKKIISYIDRKE